MQAFNVSGLFAIVFKFYGIPFWYLKFSLHLSEGKIPH